MVIKQQLLAFTLNSAAFLQSYFTKILVLSVPRFTDRQESVNELLKGIPFDFFWGVDKNEIDLQEAIQQHRFDPSKAMALQRHKKPMSLGELACSLSHRSIYEAIVANGWEKVLVLEDDVWPLFEHMEQLPAAMQELPPSWDLVYLGYLLHEEVTPRLKRKQQFYTILSRLGLMKWSYPMVSRMLPSTYSTHIKRAGFHNCTHAYAVTLEGAQKLLAAQTPVVYRADDLLSYSNLKGNLETYVTVPKFFDQEEFHLTHHKSKIKE